MANADVPGGIQFPPEFYQDFIVLHERPASGLKGRWECLLCKRGFRLDDRAAQHLYDKNHRLKLLGLNAEARARHLEQKRRVEAWRDRHVTAPSGVGVSAGRSAQPPPAMIPLGRRTAAPNGVGVSAGRSAQTPFAVIPLGRRNPPTSGLPHLGQFGSVRARQPSAGAALTRRRAEPLLRYRFTVTYQTLKDFFSKPEEVELELLPRFDSDEHRISYCYEEYKYIVNLWEQHRSNPDGEENFVAELDAFRMAKPREQRERPRFDEASQDEFRYLKSQQIREEKRKIWPRMRSVLMSRYECDTLPPPAPAPRVPPPNSSPRHAAPPPVHPPHVSPAQAAMEAPQPSRGPVVQPVRVNLQGPSPIIVTQPRSAGGTSPLNTDVSVVNGHDERDDTDRATDSERRSRRKKKKKSRRRDETSEERKRRKREEKEERRRSRTISRATRRHSGDGRAFSTSPAQFHIPSPASVPPSAAQMSPEGSYGAAMMHPYLGSTPGHGPQCTPTPPQPVASAQIGLSFTAATDLTEEIELLLKGPIDAHLKAVVSSCQFFGWKLAENDGKDPPKSLKDAIDDATSFLENWMKELAGTCCRLLREQKCVDPTSLRRLDFWQHKLVSHLGYLPPSKVEERRRHENCLKLLRSFIARAQEFIDELANKKPVIETLIILSDSDDDEPVVSRKSDEAEKTRKSDEFANNRNEAGSINQPSRVVNTGPTSHADVDLIELLSSDDEDASMASTSTSAAAAASVGSNPPKNAQRQDPSRGGNGQVNGISSRSPPSLVPVRQDLRSGNLNGHGPVRTPSSRSPVQPGPVGSNQQQQQSHFYNAPDNQRRPLHPMEPGQSPLAQTADVKSEAQREELEAKPAWLRELKLEDIPEEIEGYRIRQELVTSWDAIMRCEVRERPRAIMGVLDWVVPVGLVLPSGKTLRERMLDILGF